MRITHGFQQVSRNEIQTPSVMDLGMQTRNDLEILLVVNILSLSRDGRALRLALLLLLPHLDPLLGGEVLPQLGEGVGRLAEALEEGAVEGVEDDIVVWSGLGDAIFSELWLFFFFFFLRVGRGGVIARARGAGEGELLSLGTYLAKYRTPSRSISAWSCGGACTRWMLDLMRPPVRAVRASHVLMVMVPSIGFC